MRLALHDADDVVDIRDVMTVQPGVQAIDDADEAGRIAENGRADGDGVGARHHEFDDVLSRRYSADSDDRDIDGLPRFINHADSDRFEGGAAETAGLVGDFEGTPFDVDGHAGDRVDEGNHVRTCFYYGFCEIANARDVGGELRDERQRRGLADGMDDGGGLHGIGSEGDAAFLDVRAGDVDFQRCNAAFFRLESGGDFRVLLDGLAPDVDEHGAVDGAQEGEVVLMGDEFVYARILQADGVEHAAIDFRRARHGIAVGREGRDAFDGDAADFSEGDEIFVFLSVAESSGCGEDGIAEGDAGEIDR